MRNDNTKNYMYINEALSVFFVMISFVTVIVEVTVGFGMQVAVPPFQYPFVKLDTHKLILEPTKI